MDILEFFPTKINKAEGETLWNEIEASLRSLYHYEGDLRYFLEHRESTRAGKSVSFNVPVSVTRHSKNGYDPSFDLESPEGARMTAWLSKKNVLGSGKLVLLTLKSYGRRADAKTSSPKPGSGTPRLRTSGIASSPCWAISAISTSPNPAGSALTIATSATALSSSRCDTPQ